MRMENSRTEDEIGFRVGLMERAVAEQGRRLGELVRALSNDETQERPPPAAIMVDADSVSPFAAGFHFRETDATGRPYRWTGRGDFFEIRIRLDRRVEWSFELDLRGNDHVNVDTLRAFVDYVEVPVGFGRAGAHPVGKVPTKALSDLAVFTFYLPTHFVPSKLDPESVDHRSLSAVFYGLKLVPGENRAEAQ
jgi:hypothetical protein